MGPLVGAAILVGLPEALRFIPGAAGVIDVVREILYGLILMLLMIFRPQGILPEHSAFLRKLGTWRMLRQKKKGSESLSGSPAVGTEAPMMPGSPYSN